MVTSHFIVQFAAGYCAIALAISDSGVQRTHRDKVLDVKYKYKRKKCDNKSIGKG